MGLTLFSIPKPFRDPHIAMIQRNALLSWSLLPGVEVILGGDEEGVAEACQEFGFRHLPDLATSEHGTPRLDDLFARVHEVARHEMLCFSNGDIVFGPDLLDGAHACRAKFGRFLVVGARYNLDVTESLAADNTAIRDLQEKAEAAADLSRVGSSDYFLVTQTSGYDKLPPLLVGRAGWDNWMMFQARESRIPLIDATEGIVPVHQNHGYAHVPRPEGELPTDEWDGPESRAQVAFVDQRIGKRAHATWKLAANGKLARPGTRLDRLRHTIDFQRRRYPKKSPPGFFFKWAERTMELSNLLEKEQKPPVASLLRTEPRRWYLPDKAPVLSTYTAYDGRPESLRHWLAFLASSGHVLIQHWLFAPATLSPEENRLIEEAKSLGVQVTLSEIASTEPGSLGQRALEETTSPWLMNWEIDCVSHQAFFPTLLSRLQAQTAREGLAIATMSLKSSVTRKRLSSYPITVGTARKLRERSRRYALPGRESSVPAIIEPRETPGASTANPPVESDPQLVLYRRFS